MSYFQESTMQSSATTQSTSPAMSPAMSPATTPATPPAITVAIEVAAAAALAQSGLTARNIESPETIKSGADSLASRDIQRKIEENEKLKSILLQLGTLNQELRQVVDNRYSSPSQKRLLVEELERTHEISRRHACQLLNLARSSYWYKSTSRKPFPLKAKMPRTPLTELDRIRLLKSLSVQIRTHGATMDSGTTSFILVSLKLLGLRSAAALVHGNLKLAMEFFDQYVVMKRL